MRFHHLLALACLFAFGCGGGSADKKATSKPKPAVKADDPGALKAVADAKTKKNSAGNVVEVDFRGQNATPEQLGELTKFPSLRSVLLNGVDLTDAHIEALANSKTITNLDLRGCAVSNEWLQFISSMSQVKALRLSDASGKAQFDDDGLKHLSGLKNLKVLVLDEAWLSEAGLAHLPKDNLSELYLKNSGAGCDEAVVTFKQFPKLKKLRLAMTQFSDAGLEGLKEVKTLEELDISECGLISDAGMESVGQMKSLTKLNLWRVQITDTGIEKLAALTNLKWLNLDNTQLADDGTAHLKGMKQLEFLHLGSTLITDDGLAALTGLTTLKDLKVTRTGVTEAGVEELKKSLKDTEIQLKYVEGQ